MNRIYKYSWKNFSKRLSKWFEILISSLNCELLIQNVKWDLINSVWIYNALDYQFIFYFQVFNPLVLVFLEKWKNILVLINIILNLLILFLYLRCTIVLFKLGVLYFGFILLLILDFRIFHYNLILYKIISIKNN